jgi:hydrogenase maturation protease
MSIKLIAIGNRLMGDDGVAIHIAKKLMKRLEDKSIEVIIGETDFEYCLSKIEDSDHIIILDATALGIEPGLVTVNSLTDVHKSNYNQSLFSQHGYSLVRALESYYAAIDVIVIGIEGSNFDFSLTLSSDLEEQLNSISREVEEIVYASMNKVLQHHGVLPEVKV